MLVTTLLAVVAIVLGLVAGFVDQKVLFDPLTWFVLAIAFNTLGLGVKAWGRQA